MKCVNPLPQTMRTTAALLSRQLDVQRFDVCRMLGHLRHRDQALENIHETQLVMIKE